MSAEIENPTAEEVARENGWDAPDPMDEGARKVLAEAGWDHRENGKGEHWYVNHRLELKTGKSPDEVTALHRAVEVQAQFERDNPEFSPEGKSLDGDGFEEGQSAEELADLQRVGEIAEQVVDEGPEPDVPPAAPEYDVVDIEQIVFSPNNPRGSFSLTDDRDRELVASINESGIHEPLLVRENCGPYKVFPAIEADTGRIVWGVAKEGGDNLYKEISEQKARARAFQCASGDGLPCYELIAGARRLAAARAAGLTEVPVIIKDLNDQQAAEVQLVENLQRKDLSPLEEARGFKRMIDDFGYAVEDLARKISKSTSSVYGKLQLCKLPNLAIEALEAGYLSEAVCIMIARMPAEAMRKQAAFDAVRGFSQQGEDWTPPDSLQALAKTLRCSYANLADHIRPYNKQDAGDSFDLNYTRELKGAPFNQKDAELVHAAGSCTLCPKRTGNNRELYPDGRADICTDTTCYESKVKAHSDKLVAEAQERGQKVITGKAAEEARYSSRSYRRLTDSDYIGGKSHKIKDLVGKDAPIVLAVTPSGEVNELVAVGDVNKAIKAKGLKTPRSPESAKQAREDRIRTERDRRVLKSVGEKAGRLRPQGEFLRLLGCGMVEQAWHEACKLVCTAHELNEGAKGWNPESALKKYVKGHLKPGPTVAVMAELAYLRARFQGTNTELLKFLKVDTAAIERKVRDDFKAKEAGKKKARKGKAK